MDPPLYRPLLPTQQPPPTPTDTQTTCSNVTGSDDSGNSGGHWGGGEGLIPAPAYRLFHRHLMTLKCS